MLKQGAVEEAVPMHEGDPTARAQDTTATNSTITCHYLGRLHSCCLNCCCCHNSRIAFRHRRTGRCINRVKERRWSRGWQRDFALDLVPGQRRRPRQLAQVDLDECAVVGYAFTLRQVPRSSQCTGVVVNADYLELVGQTNTNERERCGHEE